MNLPLFLRFTALALLLILAPQRTAAQSPLGGLSQLPGMRASLAKLFGEFTAFTARANVRMQDKAGKDTMSMVMDVAMLDGRMRTEINLANLKSEMMPATVMASMKQLGMDTMVSIIRPDQQKLVMIYPGLKAYADLPLDEEQAKAAQRDPKIEKSEVGKETVDGHDCVKTKVKIDDGSGQPQEGLMWLASDLNKFPIQMQFTEDGNTFSMLFKDVKTARPEASAFEAPSAFKKHATIQELMQSAAARMFGEQPKN